MADQAAQEPTPEYRAQMQDLEEEIVLMKRIWVRTKSQRDEADTKVEALKKNLAAAAAREKELRDELAQIKAQVEEMGSLREENEKSKRAKDDRCEALTQTALPPPMPLPTSPPSQPLIMNSETATSPRQPSQEDEQRRAKRTRPNLPPSEPLFNPLANPQRLDTTTTTVPRDRSTTIAAEEVRTTRQKTAPSGVEELDLPPGGEVSRKRTHSTLVAGNDVVEIPVIKVIENGVVNATLPLPQGLEEGVTASFEKCKPTSGGWQATKSGGCVARRGRNAGTTITKNEARARKDARKNPSVDMIKALRACQGCVNEGVACVRKEGDEYFLPELPDALVEGDTVVGRRLLGRKLAPAEKKALYQAS